MEIENSRQVKNKAIKNSFIIAFLYVGLGTITVLSVYPNSPLYGDWIYIGLLLTLPVSIISFALMFADSNGYFFVLIIQTLTFLLFWFVLYRYLLKRYKRQAR
jgi:hypothetical protein